MLSLPFLVVNKGVFGFLTIRQGNEAILSHHYGFWKRSDEHVLIFENLYVKSLSDLIKIIISRSMIKILVICSYRFFGRTCMRRPRWWVYSSGRRGVQSDGSRQKSLDDSWWPCKTFVNNKFISQLLVKIHLLDIRLEISKQPENKIRKKLVTHSG